MEVRKMDSLRLALSIMALSILAASTVGCASLGKSLKGLVSGEEAQEPSPRAISTPKFSEQENMRVNTDRQYKRMNRQRMEEEADLGSQAGSLWVMEGQGAYLFSQNQMRMVGDLLNVKIEGSPKQQLQTKVKVINKLLERLEAPQARGLASQSAPQPAAAQAPQPGAPAAAGAQGGQAEGQAQGGEGAAAAAASPGKGEPPFNVQTVPTRIVEQLKDGSYRVRGMQPFMIGKREYKVIVTGIVRPEDFDDAGIDSSKLLDSQFDIVSSRKGASL